jgi:hypothetical protein
MNKHEEILSKYENEHELTWSGQKLYPKAVILKAMRELEESLSPASPVREAADYSEWKNKMIEYMYEFAWQYGRLYHIGNADKIKETVKERLQLPEEFMAENKWKAVSPMPEGLSVWEVLIGVRDFKFYIQDAVNYLAAPSVGDGDGKEIKGNDGVLYDALLEAYDSKPPLQKNPFQSIGDRNRLIEIFRKHGLVITKIPSPPKTT